MFEREQLRAEHGDTVVLTEVDGGRRRAALSDAGLGRDTVVRNVDVFGVAPETCAPRSCRTATPIITPTG